MALEVITSGMTVASPVAIAMGNIPGLVSLVYFGNMTPTDNTNLIAGGPAVTPIGTGPVQINSNWCRMWYNAALSSGWRRNDDGASGAVTLIAVGRASSTGSSVNCLLADATM